MNITIISSSPRPESVSFRISLFLEKLFKEETKHAVSLLDVREWLPHFEEGQPVYKTLADCPPELKPLGELIFGTDAFIIVSPEYNGGYPYALKRLLDHFDKHPHTVFGIVTSSPGAMGGMRAALALQHYVAALFGLLSPYMLITPAVTEKFDEKGNLLDDKFRKSIDIFKKELLWLAEKVGQQD